MESVLFNSWDYRSSIKEDKLIEISNRVIFVVRTAEKQELRIIHTSLQRLREQYSIQADSNCWLDLDKDIDDAYEIPLPDNIVLNDLKISASSDLEAKEIIISLNSE